MNKSKVIIHGKDYTKYAHVGMVVHDTKTEELDSMDLILTGIQKTQFEPFQDAEITTPDGETRYFYPNTSVENLCDFERNLFTYTINLVSRTKILERVYLPNLKIRKPLKGKKKTIYDYLKYVVMKYIVKQFPFISLSDRISELTDEVECPEFEWNHPSAKQVINDLLMTIPGNPCIVRVTNNEIDYISLAESGKDIKSYPGLKRLDKNDHQQMGDFANNIVMDASGIISNTSIKMTLSPRTNDGVELTTLNAVLILGDNKIEKINKLVAKNIDIKYANSLSGDSILHKILPEVDITEYLLEEAKYLELSAKGAMSVDDEVRINYIYYKYGENKIFISNTAKWYMFTTAHAIYNVIERKARDIAEVPYFKGITVQDIRDLVFEVDFIPCSNVRMKVNKDNPEEKDVSLYQGQNQSQIEMGAFLKTQRDAVNRLGNEIKQIPMICSLNSIPKLGDTYEEKYILSQRQIAYYNDFAIVNGTFTKDYIQKNVYYGISTKRKFTQLAQANESTIREEHMEFIVSFDDEQRTDFKQRIPMALYLAQYFNRTSQKIAAARFHTNAMHDVYGIIQYATIYPTIIGAEKSVIISAQMEDNWSIGYKVEKDKTNVIQDYVPYADNYGEIEWFEVELFKQFKTDYDTITSMKQLPDIDLSDNDTKNYVLDEKVEYYKDNGETLKFTLQFNFMSSIDEVIIGDGIGENNAIVNDLTGCRVLYSTTTKIDKRYPVIPADVGTASVRFSVDENRVQIESSIIDQSNAMSWMLVDKNDNIILAVNQDDSGWLRKYFYINVKGE